MKQILILGIIALIATPSMAQWTTGGSCEYTPNSQVGIGMSSCPTYNFELVPPGSGQGTQAIFGGNSLVGYPYASPGGTASVLELQSPGASLLSICANNTGSSNRNIWIGSAGNHFINCFSRTASAQPLEFIIEGTRTMMLWPSGQVGIGTASASLGTDTKLAVEGLISCRELKVLPSATAWPDYVFNKDFKRMSLNDVEEYIGANKHLPQLPPATQIEKEGYKVGETQAQILQAVEELYLHVIDLKKENEHLKKQLSELKHN